MTKDQIEDILLGMDVETEPGGAGWVSTKVVDKTADMFVSAMDEYYNQAIDDCAAEIERLDIGVEATHEMAIISKLESLKKPTP